MMFLELWIATFICRCLTDAVSRVFFLRGLSFFSAQYLVGRNQLEELCCHDNDDYNGVDEDGEDYDDDDDYGDDDKDGDDLA